MNLFLSLFSTFPKTKNLSKVNIQVRKDVGYKYSLARDMQLQASSTSALFNHTRFTAQQKTTYKKKEKKQEEEAKVSNSET